MVLQSFLQSLFEQPDATKLGLLVTIPVVAWWLLGVVTGPRSTLKGTRKIHRPPGLPFLGNTVELLSNSYRFQSWIYELCKKYNGEPVLLTAVGRPDLLVMASTQAFEDCLKTEFDNFPKGPFQCGNLQGILGDGIFAVDYGKWVHQRKTASNLFTARTLRDGMTATVRKHTVILRDIFERAAKTGEPIDLFKMFNRLTIEAFAEIGFGIEMKCLERKDDHPFQVAFDSAQRVIAERFLRPHLFWKLQRLLGVGIEGQLQKDVKVIDDTVLEIIKESLARRQSGETKQGGGSDVVSLFLDNFENSADSKDRSFDPTYLRDIVVNFLIAGRDTTAQALSWFFLSVSQNPHVAKKIREEIKRELPGLLDGTVSTPTMEQVSNLTYLEAALKETLRLYPSVPFTTKLAVNDIVLSDGTFVRKDSYIGLPSYALGRMTNVWGPDATEFKPERWIDENTGKIINVSAYKFVAFNAGPRLCLGMNLAMLEMKIVVASLLSRLDVKVVKQDEVTFDFSLTLPVKGQLLAHIHKLQ